MACCLKLTHVNNYFQTNEKKSVNFDNRAELLDKISREQFQNQLQLISNDMKDAPSTVDIDTNLDHFYDIIHGVCKPLLKQRM